MKRPARVLCLSLLLGMVMGLPIWGVPSSGADPSSKQEKPDQSESNKWMQSKLHSSQEILAALTNADFKKIENQSRRLLVLNFLENWRLNNRLARDSEYQGQLNSFEFATKELVRTAKAEDIDGALNSYILLTRSCVECHKLLRDLPKPQ